MAFLLSSFAFLVSLVYQASLFLFVSFDQLLRVLRFHMTLTTLTLVIAAATAIGDSLFLTIGFSDWF